jgi:hypothetical protein
MVRKAPRPRLGALVNMVNKNPRVIMSRGELGFKYSKLLTVCQFTIIQLKGISAI